MTELDRVGNGDNLNFRGFPLFCKSARRARRQREKKMKCLHGDGAAIYL